MDIIIHTVSLEKLQTTDESKQALEDLALSAEVKAALIEIKPDIEVTSTGGTVTVTTEVDVAREKRLSHEHGLWRAREQPCGFPLPRVISASNAAKTGLHCVRRNLVTVRRSR